MTKRKEEMTPEEYEHIKKRMKFLMELRNISKATKTNVGRYWLKKQIIISDGALADLEIKLGYENITFKYLIDTVVTAFMKDEPLFRNFLDEKLQKRNISGKLTREKNKLERKATEEQYGLTECEIENIFDIIAEEKIDL